MKQTSKTQIIDLTPAIRGGCNPKDKEMPIGLKISPGLAWYLVELLKESDATHAGLYISCLEQALELDKKSRPRTNRIMSHPLNRQTKGYAKAAAEAARLEKANQE